MSEITEQICEALTVGSDDILVIRVAGSSSMQQLRELGEFIRSALPENMKGRVLILGGSVEQIVCVKGAA